MKTNRVWFLIIILALLAGVGFTTFFLFSRPGDTSVPRIIEIGRFQVRIFWETFSSDIGRITYSAGGGAAMTVSESAKTCRHIIELSGLMPETTYTYTLGKNKEEYTVKTTPLSDSAFRFMVYDATRLFTKMETDTFVEQVNSHLPDFIIITGSMAETNYHNEENLFFTRTRLGGRTPIYLVPSEKDFESPGSTDAYCATLPSRHNGSDFSFDYGNSRFIILGPETSSIQKNISRPAWLRELALETDRPEHLFLVSGSGTLHEEEITATITDLGRQKKITTLIQSTGTEIPESSMLTVITLHQQYLVMDVDGPGISGLRARGEEAPEIITVADTPEAVKRSCVYCRKLLDSKRYHESIAWYRDFIQKYGERYMIDDAQFEIAQIYDRYLFDYPNALTEYRVLSDKYPNGGKTREAQHRITYIEKYADHQFQPLKIFEEAKTQTYRKDKRKAIEAVAGILTAYPGCHLEDQILFWLGYSLAPFDFQRSAEFYQQLITNYPDREITKEARVALGDLYYQYKKYNKAVAAYETVLKEPGNEYNFGLLDKIRKSKRNILREIGLYTALLILAIFLFPVFIRKPRFIPLTALRSGAFLALGYLLGGVLICLLFFRQYPELLRFTVVLAPVAAIAPVLVTNIIRKYLPSRNPVFFNIIGVTLLSAALLYLILYYFHFLPAVGL